MSVTNLDIITNDYNHNQINQYSKSYINNDVKKMDKNKHKKQN